MSAPSPVLDALQRLQSRRERRVPTIATLVGPVGLAVRAWNRWLATTGRPGVSTAEGGLAVWLDRAFAAEPIERRAVA